MSEVKTEIDSFISRVLPGAKKELKFIRDNNWLEVKNIKGRTDSYALQRVLNNRAIDNMSKLYKMAEKTEDLNNTRVKNSLKLLRTFFTILDERYSVYSEDVSWMELVEENLTDKQAKAVLKKQEEEVKLRSLVLEDINKAEHTLREINDGEEDDSVVISLHGNEPIPFMMQDLARRKWPRIIEFEKQQEPEHKNKEENEK